MVDLVVIALLSAAAGAIVWGTDRKHRHTYGELLPAGIAVAAALLTWIITVAAGLGYQPGLTWIPWIASLLVGVVLSTTATQLLGRRRTAFERAHMTVILRQY
ncbi:hypothetical protein [Arthrobacter sp. A5]|uniref:hypothetical protein n=1 Tax=Arthrobacter sp. A5 TaxID=576926 RepID=UPI003DAA3731